VNFLLLENGTDRLLLEDGSRLLLENSTTATNPFPAWLGMRQQFDEEFEYLDY
jgi:hypothetical protein